MKVSAAGLDLQSEAGAQALYKRLAVAAEQACGVEAEFDALRAAKFDHRYRATLANALYAVNRPLVTQEYQGHHGSIAVGERFAAN